MKLPPYLLFKVREPFPDPGRYILELACPFHRIGMITESELIARRTVAYCQIAGYNLHIAYKGVLKGHMILDSDIGTALQQAMDAMASWYLVEVIGKNLEQFHALAM